MRPLSVFLVCAALVSTVALSGCLNSQTVTGPKYSNDVVSIEDYYVSNLKPYAGSQVQVDFTLQNNGDNPVDSITLDVNPASGMPVVSLLCQGTVSSEKDGVNSCVFGVLESNDIRSVSITLEAPPATKPTSFPVSYSVMYVYTAYRTASLPVVDGTTLRKATSAYSQSTPSYSPIRMDFQVPPRAQHKEGDTIVNEYWGVKGEPFEVSFSFTDVSSGKYKTINPTVPARGIVLGMEGLQRADLPCDFDTNLVSSVDVKVPGKLRCSFVSTDFAEPEIFATLSASYTFNYAYAKTDTFNVQPLS